MTIKGAFQMRWYSSFVAAPVFLGVFIFWADFELFSSSFAGRDDQLWLRPASASCIGSAVCLPHFIIILSVTYKYDEFLIILCGAVGKYRVNPKTCTPHQTLALLMVLGVPSLVLLIENCIRRELFCV